MDKAELITEFRAKTQEEFDTLQSGKGIDADPDRVQKRLQELKHALSSVQDVKEASPVVEVGSLVTYEEMKKQYHCLILPGCLGDILEHQNKKIACVSPDSHIAVAFIGHAVSDEVQVPVGSSGKIIRRLKLTAIL